MSAAKKRPSRRRPSADPLAAEWERIGRNLQGIRNFHRMQAELLRDLERGIQAVREARRPRDR